MPWTQLEISVLVLIGTVLQAYIALGDLAVVRREGVEWWSAEGELIGETRRRDRRGVARELRSWRDPETHRSIVQTKIVLASWVILAMAAGTSVFASALTLI